MSSWDIVGYSLVQSNFIVCGIWLSPILKMLRSVTDKYAQTLHHPVSVKKILYLQVDEHHYFRFNKGISPLFLKTFVPYRPLDLWIYVLVDHMVFRFIAVTLPAALRIYGCDIVKVDSVWTGGSLHPFINPKANNNRRRIYLSSRDMFRCPNKAAQAPYMRSSQTPVSAYRH